MKTKNTTQRLKIVFVFFAFLFLATASAAGVLFFRLEKPPEPSALVAEPAEYDFGTIGECVKKKTVKLINRSQKPVEILHVVKSCSCTEVSLPAETIAPQKSVELEFAFDSYGRKGENKGHIAVAYKPEGDNTGNPQYAIILFRAFVDPEISKNAPLPLPVSPGKPSD